MKYLKRSFASHTRTLALLAFAGISGLTQSHLRADWPEFRGPAAQGVVDLDLPKTWSPTQNVAWRTELPGSGWSSPVVVGNTIFLTSAIEDGDSGYHLSLLKIDANSGKLFDPINIFHQPKDSPKIHQKNSHASPTPVVDGRNLYLHFGHRGSACCDLNGKVIWKNESLQYPPVHGGGGSPQITDRLMVFTRDGGNIAKVTALDKHTGSIAWETARDSKADKTFSFCTPLLIEAAGKKQLIVPGSDVVQSLDPMTGKELWRVTYSGFSVVPRPVFESGLVFVATGFMQASLLAIDPSGSGDVTDSHVRWTVKNAVPKTSSFVAKQGQVMMVSDNGVISCLNAETGQELWKKRVGGDFSSSLLLSKNFLYAFDELGVCTVLDVSKADPEIVSKNDLKERTLASPAAIGNDLLVRTSAALYRIAK